MNKKKGGVNVKSSKIKGLIDYDKIRRNANI